MYEDKKMQRTSKSLKTVDLYLPKLGDCRTTWLYFVWRRRRPTPRGRNLLVALAQYTVTHFRSSSTKLSSRFLSSLLKKAAACELIGPKKGAIFSLIYFLETFCIYYIPHNHVSRQAMPHAILQTHSAFYPHRLIVWIRQKLSKHQSYQEVKRAKRSVIWIDKKCTFYVQNTVSKGKKCFKLGRIAVQ